MVIADEGADSRRPVSEALEYLYDCYYTNSLPAPAVTPPADTVEWKSDPYVGFECLNELLRMVGISI